MNIQKLFKPYIVKRKNGQCQVLIPLVELDALCDRISVELVGKKVNAVVEIQMGQDVFMAYHSLFGDVINGKGFCTYGWHDIKVVKSHDIMRSEICFVHDNGNKITFPIYPHRVENVLESYCGPKY